MSTTQEITDQYRALVVDSTNAANEVLKKYIQKNQGIAAQEIFNAIASMSVSLVATILGTYAIERRAEKILEDAKLVLVNILSNCDGEQIDTRKGSVN